MGSSSGLASYTVLDIILAITAGNDILSQEAVAL